MPNGSTHMQIGLEVANADKYLTKTKLDIPNIDIAKMANGQDFTNSNSYLMDISHEEKIDMFFIETIKYIKENNLRENPNAMAYLYGHIIHFVTDRIFHPYVYYLEHGLKKGSILPKHSLLEYVLDEIALSLYGQKITSDKHLLDESIYDKETSSLIDQVYSKVYNTHNVTKLYKKGGKRIYLLSSILSTSYKLYKQALPPIITKPFLQINGIEDFSFLANNDRNSWQHFITGEKYNKSVKDLITLSKDLSLELISTVNRYFYGYNSSIESVYSSFPNVSYSTGLKGIRYEKNMGEYKVAIKEFVKCK